MVISSRVVACTSRPVAFSGHPSTRGRLTGLRNKPQQKQTCQNLAVVYRQLVSLLMELSIEAKCITSSMELVVNKLSEVIKASIPTPSLEKVTKSTRNTESDNGQIPPPQQEVTGAIEEYIDRQRRKCNLIIRNLPEPKAQSTSERASQDINLFKEIVYKELKINTSDIEILKATRLGKLSDKPRLLRISVSNEQSKAGILRAASKLKSSKKWSSLYFSADLTQREREANRQLRAELKCRKENGENNLRIRNGKIVTVQPRPTNQPSVQETEPMEDNTQPSQ